MEKKLPRDATRPDDLSPQHAAESLGPEVVFREHDSDTGFLQELAAMMEEVAPPLVAEIRAAIDEHDAEKLQHAAHRLKGSLIPFAAPLAMEAAQSLEDMGTAADFARAPGAYLVLDVDVQRLLAALRQVTSSEAFASHAPY